MRLRALTSPALFALAAGCGPSLEQAPPAAGTGPLLAAAPALVDGKQIFEAVCAQCHAVEPPPKLAPPMSHVARHYLEDSDPEQARERIAAWLPAPSAERSLLPGHAIATWGLMPPLELSPSQARAVAAFVLTLADTVGHQGMRMGQSGMGMGRGMMMHHDSAGPMGRGMGMGRGMMRRDTVAAAGGR